MISFVQFFLKSESIKLCKNIFLMGGKFINFTVKFLKKGIKRAKLVGKAVPSIDILLGNLWTLLLRSWSSDFNWLSSAHLRNDLSDLNAFCIKHLGITFVKLKILNLFLKLFLARNLVICKKFKIIDLYLL
jgi:hypothetical protein